MMNSAQRMPEPKRVKQSKKYLRGVWLLVLCFLLSSLFAASKPVWAEEIPTPGETPATETASGETETEIPSATESEPVTTPTPEPTPTPSPEPTPAPTSEPTTPPTTQPTPDPSGLPSQGPGTTEDNQEPYILVGYLGADKDDSIIRAKAGDSIELKLPLINWGNDDAVDVTVSLILSGLDDQFPFDITRPEYTFRFSDKIPKFEGKFDHANRIHYTRSANFSKEYGNFKIRENLPTGYYRVSFDIRYRNGEKGAYQQIERYLYIRVNNPDQKPPGADEEPTPPPPDPGNFGPAPEPAPEDPSVPRLICAGFTTNPEKVFGGDQFKLTLKLKNTSKKTLVKNIRLVLSSPGEEATFLPVDGATTQYIEQIDKDSIYEIAIDLKSNAVIPQKVYPIDLKMEYEDSKGSQHSSNEMISILVNQQTRCDFGKVQVMPDQVMVGAEANVMFSIYNKGKSTLYNVSVLTPENGPLNKAEVFLGNMESGTSKDVDMMVSGLQATYGEPIELVVSYEDADGNVSTLQKKIEGLTITDAENFPGMSGEMPVEPGFDPEGDESGEPESKKEIPLWAWIAGGSVLALIVLGLVIKLVRKRRAAKEQEELDEMV